MIITIQQRLQKGNAFIHDVLNKTAMYRLVLYVLSFYVVLAFIYSLFDGFGLVPFTPINMIISLLTILSFSYISNTLFAKIFKAQTNIESVYITAFILFCIITPPHAGTYISFFSLAIWASCLASASKYILAIGKRHIFNPVAVSLVITAFALHQSASWWIGRGDMMPFVLIGGLLIAMKIRRFDMVLSFIITSLTTIGIMSVVQNQDTLAMLASSFSDTSLFFFAFIMLTEPITTPPTRYLRILYGVLVGILFAPNFTYLGMYATPEFALVIGNIFSYLVSPKGKYILKLQEKVEVAKNTFDYIFNSDRLVKYLPGQYMEWTLGHTHPDTRGNRRYFTLASSPSEKHIHLGLRQSPEPSSFKKHLDEMEIGDKIIASQLAGDFVLPTNKNEKLVFIAGGIGITPFRSMIQFLIDREEKRDIILLYSNREKTDVAYRDVFKRAEQEIKLRTFYFYSEVTGIQLESDERGTMITEDTINELIPDFKDRTFYISGPNSMVSAFKSTLKKIGVRSNRVKADYFPGL